VIAFLWDVFSILELFYISSIISTNEFRNIYI